MPRARKFDSATGTEDIPKGYRLCNCNVCIGKAPLGEAKLVARSTWYRHHPEEMETQQQQVANISGSQVVSGLETKSVHMDLEAQARASQNQADLFASHGIQSVKLLNARHKLD